MSSIPFVLNMLEEEENEDETTLVVAVAAAEQVNQFENRNSHRGGSVLNHRVINRNRIEGNNRLFHDYFVENVVYPDYIFRRRFRMRRSLFFRIQEAIELHDSYFVQRYNAAEVLGLSSLQKITAALRILAYEVSVNVVDEYLRLGNSTAIESFRRFVKAVVEIFGDEYLRRPSSADIARLMVIAEQRGFPGMLGSIDCMHWKWRNCPTAWLEGRGPQVRYTINGHEYTIGYYLADDIYPSWPTFVKTIPCPQGNKKFFFAAAQESARKDVERAFGVLQAQFAIIRGPSRFWDVETLNYIMTACIVLHNMIVEDERGTDFDFDYDVVEGTPSSSLSSTHTNELLNFMQIHQQIRDRRTHFQL